MIKTHLQIPNIFSNGTEQARLMVCDHYQKHVYKQNYINHWSNIKHKKQLHIKNEIEEMCPSQERIQKTIINKNKWKNKIK